jgi:anaerobic ribonucleoside-triphosphate reductase activating protein
MQILNIASIVSCTESEGPGRRFALWVQGCLKRCPGCCNPHMLEIAPRNIVPCDLVFEQILQAKVTYGIEGATFLGGEPMLQAKGFSYIARNCQGKGLSVMVFTGYTLAELQQLRLPATDELVSFTDILVTGPYLRQYPETMRNWVGSQNQEFHFLTARYASGIEYDSRYSPSVEFWIGRGGKVRLNGEPIDISFKRYRPIRVGNQALI